MNLINHSPGGPQKWLAVLGTFAKALPYIGIFVLTTLWTAPRIEGGAGTFIAVASAILLVIAFFILYFVGVDLNNLRLLRRSHERTAHSLRDGDTTVMCGTTMVSGGMGPLTSGLSRVPCVAHGYIIAKSVPQSSSNGADSRRVVCAEGYHMCPSAIKGSERTLRLLSFPSLEADLRNNVVGDQWEQQARELLESIKPTAPAASWSALRARLLFLQRSVVGQVDEDYYMAPFHSALRLVIDEEVLPVDIEICAIGTYEQKEDGLSGRRARFGPNLVIYAGTPDEVIERLSEENGGYWKAVKILVLLAALVLGLPYLPYPLAAQLPLVGDAIIATPAEQEQLRKTAEETELAVSRDPSRALELVLKGRNIEHMSSLMKQGVDPNTGIWKMENGSYQLPLVYAVRDRQIDLIETLLDAGADPNIREPYSGKTAVDAALLIEACDIVELLTRFKGELGPGRQNPCVR